MTACFATDDSSPAALEAMRQRTRDAAAQVTAADFELPTSRRAAERQANRTKISAMQLAHQPRALSPRTRAAFQAHLTVQRDTLASIESALRRKRDLESAVQGCAAFMAEVSRAFAVHASRLDGLTQRLATASTRAIGVVAAYGKVVRPRLRSQRDHLLEASHLSARVVVKRCRDVAQSTLAACRVGATRRLTFAQETLLASDAALAQARDRLFRSQRFAT